MPGSDLPGQPDRAGRATTAASAFRRHAWAYAVAAGVLTGANWYTGTPWWSFWPLAVWGIGLLVHYLVHKARAVDEDWVEERTADLHSKSYDAGHIDRIAEDFGGKTADHDGKK